MSCSIDLLREFSCYFYVQNAWERAVPAGAEKPFAAERRGGSRGLWRSGNRDHSGAPKGAEFWKMLRNLQRTGSAGGEIAAGIFPIMTVFISIPVQPLGWTGIFFASRIVRLYQRAGTASYSLILTDKAPLFMLRIRR